MKNQRTWLPITALSGAVLILVAGCVGSSQQSNLVAPVTKSDPATTQPSYWYDQPAAATVEAEDFDKLVASIERTLRDYCFKIDRVDYRLGLITTEPMITAQFFEPWRRDNQTIDQVTQSSLATHRRTAEVRIDRNADGSFTAMPRVLIERQTVVEHRITSVVLYKGAFKSTPDPKDRPTGSKESDRGILVPQKDWYAISRDEKLEKKLAEEIRSALR